METEEILNELTPIFREVLKKQDILLTSETTAKDIEGWDSLSNMRLITAIEKHFNIRFGLREILKFRHVGDLYSSIQSKTK